MTRWVANLVTVVLAVGVCILMSDSARAERWYGNIVLSALNNSSTLPSSVDEGANYQAHANINVEDILFYKNRFRLATNVEWRHQGDGYEQYRPTYYFDLFGYGYTFNSTYSRYKVKGKLLQPQILVDVFTRDWRNVLQLSPAKLPTFSLLHSEIRTFNNPPYEINNQRQRTMIAQSAFSRSLYSLRGVYQRTRTDDYGNDRINNLVRTSSGNLALTSPSSRIGSAAVTYNYFDTRRTLAGSKLSTGKTHSVTAMVSSTVAKHVSAGVSYSGQYSQNKALTNPTNNRRNEVFSGSVGYAPTGYLDFQAIKGYQIDGATGSYDISEYATLQANFSRYLRQGVDTRASFTRTLFQQGNRVREFRDSLGQLDSIQQIDHFYLDTYYGSVTLSPAPYIKVSQGLSISRDSDPVQASQRWQMSATTDSRMWLRDNLEGRLSYSNTYQGDRLRLGHLSGETINVGASWTPLRNASVAMAYIHSVYNSSTRNTSSSVSFYSNYSFRRIYNLSLSYNGREQSTQSSVPNNQTGMGANRPRVANAQLLVYTSARSTLTVGYNWERTPVTDSDARTTTTWRGNLNLQI